MNFHATVSRLADALTRGLDRITDAQVTLVQDCPKPPADGKPAAGGLALPHLLTQLDEELVAMTGQFGRALAATERARAAAVSSRTARRVLAELGVVQACLEALLESYVQRLSDHATGRELDELAQRLGGEWLPWNCALRAAIRDAWDPLQAAGHELWACRDAAGELGNAGDAGELEFAVVGDDGKN